MTRRRPASDPTPGSLADATPDADPESVARSILLRRLTLAPRTRAELRQDLEARSVPPEVAERVLTRFAEVGLIDDAEYARMWVSSRHRSKGEARSVMRQQLRRKGVDDHLIDDALATVTSDDEHERARALVRSRLPATARLERPARVRRLVGLLQRRGYPAGVCYAVVTEVLGELDDA